MRIVRGLLRGDMPQLLEPFHKRMVAGDRFDTSVGINEVGAAIANMCDRHLLPEYKCCRQGGPAARSLSLDRALRLAYRGLHDLLKGFIHRICLDMEEIRMEFSQNIPGDRADSCIAGNLTKLVSAHAVGHNIQAKR